MTSRPARCQFQAVTLAFHAKAERLVRADVEALTRQAAAEVGRSSPVYAAIAAFAAAVTAPGATKLCIEQAGAELLARLDALQMPIPPDVAAERKDIHG